MWTESRGRLPTYLLVGGIRSKHRSCMRFFFFLNEYRTCLPKVKKIWRFQSCVSEDQRFWILAHVFRGPRIFGLWLIFQRTKGLGSWLMFSKDQGFLDPGSCFQRTQDFWVLAHVFRGPKVWDLGSAHVSKGPGIFGLWLMFSEDQKFGILAHIFRGPRVFGSWLMFLEDLGFLGFGLCFQRTKGLGS